MSYSPQQFIKLNGYSNSYWGWGAEDDDMSERMNMSKISYERPEKSVNYFMIKHKQSPMNNKRYKIYKERAGNDRYKYDGLNNVNYTLKSVIKYSLYTNLLINVGVKPSNL